MPRAHADPGTDLLAIFAIRHTEDMGFEHRGMGVENLFDFARVDVLAAANDHILETTDNAHVALGVHHSEIARMQPAAGVDCFGGALGLLPIALHHRIAAATDLARCVDWNDVSVLADQFYFKMRPRTTDRLNLF